MNPNLIYTAQTGIEEYGVKKKHNYSPIIFKLRRNLEAETEWFGDVLLNFGSEKFYESVIRSKKN